MYALLFFLYFLCVTAASNESKGQQGLFRVALPGLLELSHNNNYYFLSTFIVGYGYKVLLLDTASPLLMIKSSSSESSNNSVTSSRYKESSST